MIIYVFSGFKCGSSYKDIKVSTILFILFLDEICRIKFSSYERCKWIYNTLKYCEEIYIAKFLITMIYIFI